MVKGGIYRSTECARLVTPPTIRSRQSSTPTHPTIIKYLYLYLVHTSVYTYVEHLQELVQNCFVQMKYLLIKQMEYDGRAIEP